MARTRNSTNKRKTPGSASCPETNPTKRPATGDRPPRSTGNRKPPPPGNHPSGNRKKPLSGDRKPSPVPSSTAKKRKPHPSSNQKSSSAGKRKIPGRKDYTKEWCRAIRKKLIENEKKGKTQTTFQPPMLSNGEIPKKLNNFKEYIYLGQQPRTKEEKDRKDLNEKIFGFFGLHIDECIIFGGKPVLPSDHETFDDSLRKTAVDRVSQLSRDEFLGGKYNDNDLAQRIKEDTADAIAVSKDKLELFPFLELAIDARQQEIEKSNSSDCNDKNLGKLVEVVARQQKTQEAISEVIAGQQKTQEVSSKLLDTYGQALATLDTARKEHDSAIQILNSARKEHDSALKTHDSEIKTLHSARKEHGSALKTYDSKIHQLDSRMARIEKMEIEKMESSRKCLLERESSRNCLLERMESSKKCLFVEEADLPAESQPVLNAFATPVAARSPLAVDTNNDASDLFPAVEDGFSLCRALNDSLKQFVTDVQARRIGLFENYQSKLYLLLNLCEELHISEVEVEAEGGSKHKTWNISGDFDKLPTIEVEDVVDEDADDILFLPMVHVIRPTESNISGLVSHLLDDSNPETSLAFHLIVGADDENGVEFTIHRAPENVPEESAIYSEQFDSALDNMNNIDGALGLHVQHVISVTLVDREKDIVLAFSTGKNYRDFASRLSPYTQMIKALTAMNNIVAVKLTSSAPSGQCKPIGLNPVAFNNLMLSGKRISFERVLFVESTIWEAQAASGELQLEFKSCRFEDDALFDCNPFPPSQGGLTLKVKFTNLNDDYLPNPVKFLNSLIKAVDKRRISYVEFNEWQCNKTKSEPLFIKLAELSRKLPGGLQDPGEEQRSDCLDLRGVNFNEKENHGMIQIRQKIRGQIELLNKKE